jgi:threonine dehydratase
MAAAATAAAASASFPAAVAPRRDGRRPSRVSAAATTPAEAAAALAAVPAPPAAPLVRVVPESLQRESGCLVAGFRERGAGAGLADGDGFGDAAAGGGGEGPGAMEYLTSVLSSKVYDVAIESPLQLATKLSERLGVNLWIKREDLQPVIDGDAQPSIYLLPPRHLFWVGFVFMDAVIYAFLLQKKHHAFIEMPEYRNYSCSLCLWIHFAPLSNQAHCNFLITVGLLGCLPR